MKSSEILMGTPDYISPEQALGEPLDGRSDIYSLAVTLFFLLIGRPPFKAESSIAMALMHIHETPPVLGELRVDITPQIDRVIAKALAKWPEDRYQTAGEFSAAFAEAVANAESYALSESDAKRKTFGFRGRVKQAIEASPLVIQFKTFWKNSSKSRQIVVSLVLLLAVILGSVTSVSIFNSFTNKHSQQQTTHTSTPTDLLAGDPGDWPPQSSTFFFQNQQYHIRNNSPLYIAAAFYGTNSNKYQFADFRLTVSASEIHRSPKAADFYGIIFRSSTDQAAYYLFEIAAWKGGQYAFSQKNGQGKASNWKTLESGPLSSLLPNLGQLNTITVEAKGNTFKFFVNKTQVGQPFIDNSGNAFPSGIIGLCVEEQNAEVMFSQLHIDRL